MMFSDIDDYMMRDFIRGKQGLKDHEIAIVVNSVRDAAKIFIPHQCLRAVIEQAVVEALEKMDRRIDAK